MLEGATRWAGPRRGVSEERQTKRCRRTSSVRRLSARDSPNLIAFGIRSLSPPPPTVSPCSCPSSLTCASFRFPCACVGFAHRTAHTNRFPSVALT